MVLELSSCQECCLDWLGFIYRQSPFFSFFFWKVEGTMKCVLPYWLRMHLADWFRERSRHRTFVVWPLKLHPASSGCLQGICFPCSAKLHRDKCFAMMKIYVHPPHTVALWCCRMSTNRRFGRGFTLTINRNRVDGFGPLKAWRHCHGWWASQEGGTISILSTSQKRFTSIDF